MTSHTHTHTYVYISIYILKILIGVLGLTAVWNLQESVHQSLAKFTHRFHVGVTFAENKHSELLTGIG